MKIRTRFAPSPTGGLHLGGVRTVLYNYLFARQNGGEFILRIEDTDQTRFVPGAETYITNCLEWCGLMPDEGPQAGGAFGPYRQSERKDLYLKYAKELIAKGFAYYAFDSTSELEKMRNDLKTAENPSPQYGSKVRMKMKNSLSLDEAETQKKINAGEAYVVRIKIPDNETIRFNDMIHGEVVFDSSVVDDKVLLKADGMPTYHLAVVVDDYLMKITHAFRGEEWLSSAPVHILLWKYLFGIDKMPQWAHLPLILGPSGKLSKRDGAKYGFPVFAMNWTDPKTNDFTEGFKEKGFLPEAFINMLAMLGWNDGTTQEIFSLDELIQKFSIERVHKAGAKFDYEKAKWFNQEWIKKLDHEELSNRVAEILKSKGVDIANRNYLKAVISLVKERCTLMSDFYEQSSYFFKTPETLDITAIQLKWKKEKSDFFSGYIQWLSSTTLWDSHNLEMEFKNMAVQKNLKPVELQLPLRIMMVGGKFGPAVFTIAEMIGKEETIKRIKNALNLLNT